MTRKCIHCGQERDNSQHGLKWNLSMNDAGSPGGQGPCGDCHEWTPRKPLPTTEHGTLERLKHEYIACKGQVELWASEYDPIRKEEAWKHLLDYVMDWMSEEVLCELNGLHIPENLQLEPWLRQAGISDFLENN